MTETQATLQQKLIEILYELSIELYDREKIESFVLQFKDIYILEFRHCYSRFFPLIKRIAEEEERVSNLDSLLENLQLIQQTISERCKSDSSFTNSRDSIDKLFDHLNLEVSRWNQYSSNRTELAEVKNQVALTQQALEVAQEKLGEAQKQASSLQTEIITVLSIFSAIVIATVGSFSYITSAMAGMQQTHVFKASLIVLISGMVVFNVIALLMYLIAKITGKNIYAACETPDCSCLTKKGKQKCWGITRIRRRLPYIFWFNGLFLVLIFIDALLWNSTIGIPMRVWQFL